MLYHIILAPPTLSLHVFTCYLTHSHAFCLSPRILQAEQIGGCSSNYHAANPAAQSTMHYHAATIHICNYAKLSRNCHAAKRTIEVTFWRQHCHSCITSPIIHSHHLNDLKHLPNVETRFYCPQAFLTLDFQCRDAVSEFKTDVLGLKELFVHPGSRGDHAAGDHQGSRLLGPGGAHL